MRKIISILISIATLASASYTYALTFAPTKEVVLPKSEAIKVEELTCTKHNKISAAAITAYQYSGAQIPQPFHYAYVQCRPHGEFKNSPIYFTSLCDFTNKKWLCEEPKLHISVALYNRRVDVVPGAIKPEQAEDILKKISAYGGFRGPSIDKAIGDHCNFHSTSNAEELELMCQDVIKISFWCPQPELTHCPRVLAVDSIIYK